MKIYHNALSDSLQKECIENIQQNLGNRIWTSSSVNWSDTVREHITGSCISCDVDNSIVLKLQNELEKYFPVFDNLIFQFYIWQHNSGISLHDDGNRKFSATAYLNNFWNSNWGGTFLWYENSDDISTGKVNGLIPQCKTLVVNDEKQSHFVTPVAFTAPDFRVTIQIWGE